MMAPEKGAEETSSIRPGKWELRSFSRVRIGVGGWAEIIENSPSGFWLWETEVRRESSSYVTGRETLWDKKSKIAREIST